jgi:hypothetical protein
VSSLSRIPELDPTLRVFERAELSRLVERVEPTLDSSLLEDSFAIIFEASFWGFFMRWANVVDLVNETERGFTDDDFNVV